LSTRNEHRVDRTLRPRGPAHALAKAVNRELTRKDLRYIAAGSWPRALERHHEVSAPPLATRRDLRTGLRDAPSCTFGMTFELFDLAVRGEIKVLVGGTYSLERVSEAHTALEGRATTGKLVLVP
jgi:NADPH:quinone reductase-like Zn-dependent oxidoreductase